MSNLRLPWLPVEYFTNILCIENNGYCLEKKYIHLRAWDTVIYICSLMNVHILFHCCRYLRAVAYRLIVYWLCGLPFFSMSTDEIDPLFCWFFFFTVYCWILWKSVKRYSLRVLFAIVCVAFIIWCTSNTGLTFRSLWFWDLLRHRNKY